MEQDRNVSMSFIIQDSYPPRILAVNEGEQMLEWRDAQDTDATDAEL